MDGNEARVWGGHSEEVPEGFQVSKKGLALQGDPKATLAHLYATNFLSCLMGTGSLVMGSGLLVP